MSTSDVMSPFELYQPTDLQTALDLLAERGADAWRLAGGQDSLDWFKDRVKQPAAVVDLTGIEELKGVRESADGGLESYYVEDACRDIDLDGSTAAARKTMLEKGVSIVTSDQVI